MGPVGPLVLSACAALHAGALCPLPGGGERTHELVLAEGELVHLRAVSAEANLELRLDPPGDRAALTVDELLGPAGPEELWYVAPAPGVYHLRLRSRSARPAFVRLLVLERRAASAADRARVAAVTEQRELRPALDGDGAERRHAALARAPAIVEALKATGLAERAANLRRYMARAHLRDGDEVAARALLDEVVTEAERLGADVLLAYALDELNSIEKRAGRFPQAMAFARREIEAADRSGYPPARALARLNFGVVAQRVGEADAALAAYDAAAALYDELGQGDNVARCRFNAGGIRFHRGELDEASRAFDEARALFAARGDLEALRVIDGNRAAIENQLGRPERAVAILEEALARGGEETLDARRFRIGALDNLGAALTRLGHDEAARARYEEAVALARAAGQLDHLSTALQNLGHLEVAAGALERAKEQFHESVEAARASGDLERLAGALGGLADAERQSGNRTAARAAADEGLSLAVAHGFALREIDLRRIRARIERADAALDVAMAEIEHARLAVERLRSALDDKVDRSTFLSRQRSVYQLEVAVLLDLERARPGAGFAESAFAAAERGRARYLLDLLGVAGSAAELPPAAPLEALRSRLPRDALFVEYVVDETEAYAFAVDRGGLVVHRLAEPRALEAAVAALEVEFTRPTALGAAAYTRAAATLYDLAIAPLAEGLAGKRRLLVAPDGALHRVSFAALVPEARGASGYSGLDYLSRRVAVSRVASAAAWLELGARERPASAAPVAAFGDPELGAAAHDPSRARVIEGLASLPGSRDELATLGTLLPGANLFLGEAATEARLKEDRAVRSARRLHFATHALPDETRPERSAVVLTAGAGEDGLLEAREIAALELGSELVVLSACRSARGREVSGEGFLGLTQAFFEAGAGAVVASLQAVDDRAAARFMARFYRRVAAGALHHDALAEAQRETFAAGGADAHPSRWAPFVLIETAPAHPRGATLSFGPGGR